MAAADVEILSSGYLPQVGVAPTSKRSLVIYPYSDSESSTNESNSLSSGGRCKKLKPNLQNVTKWNDEEDSSGRATYSVAPSAEKISRCDGMPLSSEVKRKENFIQHSQKDFWDSIRNNYAYLMDDYLITTCKQTNEELLRINPDFSSSSCNSPSWTCTQFIQRFNELHDALHSLQAMAAEQNDKNSFLQNTTDKLQEITRDCQLLKDQALLLEIRYPEMKDDIWRRCNILNNKWETLELTLWPKRKQEREGLLQKVTGKMKDIRRWLREVDHKLANLDTKQNWSKEHITEVIKSQQVVQQEIETRGREVTSLVKDCQSLEGAAAAETLKRVRRVASNLERSWHTTWLRSLEIQCLTQQVLQDKQLHYTRDQNESDVDEGPLTKHRRLTSDFSPRILNMDNKTSKDSSSCDGSKDATSRRSTREIGILCSVTKDLVSVNDKCIMVGTTGIAALKAKYGDDFTNFEIIQDVGYSSESSTHLSSDDVSDHIRIYSYSPVKRSYSCDVNSNISLSKGTDYSTVSNLKLFGHSSLGSNSSHNDSGFGALEAVADAGEISPGGLDEQYLSSSPGANGDYYGESDLLDSVDFPNISEFENEHTDYGLDEMESSDSLDNFQNRSSFTSSTRVFYKMTSVDSDYGDKGSQEKESLKAYSISSSEDEVGTERIEARMDNKLFDNGTGSNTSPVQNSVVLSSENGSRLKSDSLAASNSDNELRSNDDHSSEQNVPNTDISSLSDIECLPVTHSKTSSDPQDSDISEEFLLRRRYANHLCSTPCVQHPSHHQKPQPKNHRKGRRRRLSFDGSHDSTNNNWDTLLCSCSKNKTTRSNRVREWLKRCSDGKTTSSAPHNSPPAPVPDESASDDHHHLSPLVVIETAVDSSCDASGEYTTTESDDESADYHAHSGSVMGSVETVVPLSITCFRGIPLTGTHDGELTELLPPPPPPTPPTSCEETSVGTYSYQLRKDGSFRKATRSISEGDLCMSGLKRSGMKHFNESRGALSGAKLSENPEFIVPCMSTKRQTSESRRNTRMWRRSLPIVLCSESGHSGSDVPSQYIKSSATLTSLGYSSDISHWQKSLSGSGRRSRKRSSSSSKCSSTKSSNFANRHHHHGSRTTISASRGRHLSQSSGPHYKETLFAFEESQTTKPIDEDVLQSISSHVEENRPCIPRSPENDVILTQYEEQSTASDQVWDGYQEMPYLSEAYSEPTVDEDAVRKLTEFGDDYCSAIGSQPHGLGSSNRKRAETSAFPTKSLTYFAKTTTTCPPTLKSSNNTVDSDSDIEDLHDILTETCRALQFARNTLNCRREGRVLSQAENAELLATCQTHLRCLEVICEHIEIDGKEKNFSREDLERLHDLIEEWAELQRTVVMNQQEVQNCEEKVLKAQKNIDDLYTNMAELSSVNNFNPKDISALSDLQEKMEAIQMALSTLLETKAQLLAVNIQVHRIVTESGDTSSPLKQDITELYQQWEDAYEENGNQLTDFQLLYNKWQEYEQNYQKLISRLREEQKRLQSSCDTTLQTGEDDDDYTSFEDELEELHINAGFLECRLRGAVVWSKISNDLRQLHSEIQQLKRRQRHHSESVMEELRMSPTKSVHYSDAAFDDEVRDDVHQKELEGARLKSEEDVSDLPLEASDAEKPTTGSQSRLWRVFRAALPIQLALVFLYCLACALEPHCCDLLNNFNFSLSPQLRYVRGPPPV